MKKKFNISLLGYSIGISVTLISLFPWQYKYKIPDLSGILGLSLIIISFVYGMYIANKKRNVKGRRLTSRLMPLYKYYMPILVVIALLFNSCLLGFEVYPGHDISIFIVLEIMLCISMIFLWPCLKLRTVFLHKNEIIVIDSVKSLTIDINEVKKIRRSFVMFYLLKLKDNTKGFKSFTMLPKVEESLNLFITPSSIKLLKNKLTN
ncbi:hypothetical protein QA597_11890 [Marinilabiliaceae bacterium ANBcel2]|nr:hypothetical protein [Marinilabiliaceae bacterium ANBcel2]